jgi:hypothetical protein
VKTCALLVIAGCSSSSGTKAQGDCAIEASASGGITWDSAADKNAQLGCGAVGSNGTDLNVDEFGAGSAYHELDILFDTPVAAGQTGTVTATVSLTVEDSATPRSTWKSGSGACSIELTKNVSMPDSFFKNKYIIGGDGTCTGDLAATGSNSLPPVTLDPFTFQSFDDYSP